MGKKIVVITGSPRKNGNSFAMTDAFIQAAERKGHTIEQQKRGASVPLSAQMPPFYLPSAKAAP